MNILDILKRNAVNLAVTVILIIIMNGMSGSPIVQPVEPGDPSLLKPMKPSTVSERMLHILSFGLPTVTYVVLKRVFPKVEAPSDLEMAIAAVQAVTVTSIVTDVIKYNVGRPRPFFLTLCNQKKALDSNYDCSDVSDPDIAEARVSFPSGHSSKSFSACVFIALFMMAMLQQLNLAGYASITSLICLLPLMLSTWVARTRLSDYWHHYADVVGGACLGSMISLVLFYVYFSKSFQKDNDGPLPLSSSGPNYEATA